MTKRYLKIIRCQSINQSININKQTTRKSKYPFIHSPLINDCKYINTNKIKSNPN